MNCLVRSPAYASLVQQNLTAVKCWYYDTALAAGTEEVPKNLPPEKIPEDILTYQRSGCLHSVGHKHFSV